MDLNGRVALVTGASSGIGAQTAVRLAARGARLIVTGRDRQRLDAVGREVGGVVLVADLAESGGLQSLLEALGDRTAPELVVHNAGIGLSTPVEATTDEDLQRLLAVNLLAPIRITRALLPRLRAGGSGRLVFVTSIAAQLAVAQEAAYSASKAALANFAAGLRDELAGSGVGVTTVAPGVVDTPFFDNRGEPYRRRFPRALTAERVAESLVRAVETERTEVIVPGWLRAPVVLRAAMPGVYARLAGRWG